MSSGLHVILNLLIPGGGLLFLFDYWLAEPVFVKVEVDATVSKGHGRCD